MIRSLLSSKAFTLISWTLLNLYQRCKRLNSTDTKIHINRFKNSYRNINIFGKAIYIPREKSRIQETKNLLTDAVSSTDIFVYIYIYIYIYINIYIYIKKKEEKNRPWCRKVSVANKTFLESCCILFDCLNRFKVQATIDYSLLFHQSYWPEGMCNNINRMYYNIFIQNAFEELDWGSLVIKDLLPLLTPSFVKFALLPIHSAEFSNKFNSETYITTTYWYWAFI